MRTLVYGGRIVNEGQTFQGAVVIEDDRIADMAETAQKPRGIYDREVDATGCFVMPGIIDSHVHFREPGLTRKADISSESRAAAYGGVTTYFEMPNTVPQTTTLEAWVDKQWRGARESHVNYAFFFGATNDNVQLFARLDRRRIPGIKLFMGSSTGNMLVDCRESLAAVFQTAHDLGLPVMAHCEDSGIIDRNMRVAQEAYGDDPPVSQHAFIRSEEACWQSSSLAVSLAREYGTRLHIAHVSTARELSLFEPWTNGGGQPLPAVTGEAVIAHLCFSNADYQTLGALIKCNPSVKTPEDRAVLRHALMDGRITTVATDHAPHLRAEKEGGAAKAASGMPMVQFSLVSMLDLVDAGVLTLERVVELMCHNPARLFCVDGRGYLRPGYKADLAIVRPNARWTLAEGDIQSKCGWSPLTGHEFKWQVQSTICNGHLIYHKGVFDADSRGEAVAFREHGE